MPDSLGTIMTKPNFIRLCCPKSHAELSQQGDMLCDEEGTVRYAIRDGIPNCTYPENLSADDARWSRFYDHFAPFYDWSERVLGKLLTGIDIVAARKEVESLIPAQPGGIVLEVSPGPGVYQSAIAAKVGGEGSIVALDLSLGMLLQCRKRTCHQKPRPQLVQGNASYLPFPDSSFDGLFHFGGINLFNEPNRAFDEFVRVVRPGGWVIVGDEQFSPEWAKRRDFRAECLRHANPGYERIPPEIPPSLEIIEVRQIFSGLAYLKICRVPPLKP